ncbi:hypothetical protein [Haliscomenobacter hydrossis]|uniref:Uncharacterized protein n=1 Tax=Haliscomenobacter hydrossis (strain ATCC 27775 / DSM 1100 / LMG 10767 / O) TaxID=760192 RepID=F4L2G6_HALH1|nr:hypothetical protein [Haliscomenobacter hydrossis]AEE53884.1 hypothetical protein Halhy_6062 [Haliscomenobacter hydrossis DSM 1100]
MKRKYVIYGTSNEKIDVPKVIILDSSGKIEHIVDDLFATTEENNGLITHVRHEFSKLTRPIRTGIGAVNFVVMAVLSTILSFVFKLNEPLIRGWRLNVIKRVALHEAVQVPSWRPDLLISYFLKGLVLIVSRTLYFLPAIIIIYLSGFQFFDIIKELFYFLRDKWLNANTMGYAEFFMQKVLPQFGMEIFIHFVVLLLYVVFVWPIYRIITIKYALSQCNSAGFFSVKQIRSAISIFRKNADSIYGIYAFTLTIDVLILFLFNALNFASFGIFSLFIPVLGLFFRYWMKGYAYGMLGRVLIQKSAL